jgi:hypothetical protein
MKLVFEMVSGRPYLYREDEKHHQVVELNPDSRKSPKLSVSILDQECDMTCHGDDFYIVFDVDEAQFKVKL